MRYEDVVKACDLRQEIMAKQKDSLDGEQMFKMAALAELQDISASLMVIAYNIENLTQKGEDK
jgi:hypothetical protein